jgi:hypothetical protein
MPMKAVAALVICGSVLLGQSGGLPPEWEVRKSMDELSAQWKRVQGSLAQAKPEDWVSKGAPEVYVRQWKSCQDQTTYVMGSLEKLARQPDKLSTALDAYFRTESLQSTAMSVIDGVRRYQNPAIADLMTEDLNTAILGRERLRQYISDLSVSREREFQMMDSEAQRCRDALMKQPVPAKREKPNEKAAGK